MQWDICVKNKLHHTTFVDLNSMLLHKKIEQNKEVKSLNDTIQIKTDYVIQETDKNKKNR